MKITEEQSKPIALEGYGIYFGLKMVLSTLERQIDMFYRYCKEFNKPALTDLSVTTTEFVIRQCINSTIAQ